MEHTANEKSIGQSYLVLVDFGAMKGPVGLLLYVRTFNVMLKFIKKCVFSPSVRISFGIENYVVSISSKTYYEINR